MDVECWDLNFLITDLSLHPYSYTFRKFHYLISCSLWLKKFSSGFILIPGRPNNYKNLAWIVPAWKITVISRTSPLASSHTDLSASCCPAPSTHSILHSSSRAIGFLLSLLCQAFDPLLPWDAVPGHGLPSCPRYLNPPLLVLPHFATVF